MQGAYSYVSFINKNSQKIKVRNENNIRDNFSFLDFHFSFQ